MTTFCIDIDNVIGRTDDVMRRVIANYTQDRVRLAYADIVEFNYYECRDSSGNGITKQEWKDVHELFSDPPYLWQIEPLTGAIEGLRELAKHGTLHLATARIPKARRTTIEWLEYHRVPAHDIHFLRHSEKHVSLRPFTAAVEDDYTQGIAFAKDSSTPCYLLRHPWNTNKPPISGVQWVDDWADLTKQLVARART